MVTADDLGRMLQDAMANDEFHSQLEVWGIDPDAFGALLNTYSGHAGEFHTEEGSAPDMIVLTSMVAGFEIGYRCRMQVEEEETGIVIPNALPL